MHTGLTSLSSSQLRSPELPFSFIIHINNNGSMTWLPATKQRKIILAAVMVFCLLIIVVSLLLPFSHTAYHDLPTSIEQFPNQYATFHFPGPARPKIPVITRSSQPFQCSFPG